MSDEHKGRQFHGHLHGHGGFKKVEAKAAEEYGSEEAGKRVAGAIYQKMRREGKLHH